MCYFLFNFLKPIKKLSEDSKNQSNQLVSVIKKHLPYFSFVPIETLKFRSEQLITLGKFRTAHKVASLCAFGSAKVLRQEVSNQEKNSFERYESIFLFGRHIARNTSPEIVYRKIRSICLRNPEDQVVVEEHQETLAIEFLMSMNSPIKLPLSFRKRLAIQVTSHAYKSLQEPLPDFFSETMLIRSVCELLFKCDLEEKSSTLNFCLNRLDSLSDSYASKCYRQIKPEDLEDEVDIEESILVQKGVLALETIDKEGEQIAKLPLKKREELAEASLHGIIALLDQAKQQHEIKSILEGFCSPNGLLHKCKLPNDSDTLAHILITLNSRTENLASTYYNR